MNARLHAALAAMPARQLTLICAGAVAVAALLAWTVALRGPLAAYRQQHAALVSLRASSSPAATVPGAGRSGAAPASVPVAVPAPLDLVDAIGRDAKRAGVDVTSAAQGADRHVGGLRQQMIDLTATGTYAAIQSWLNAIETSQPAVGIVQLDVRAGDSAGRRKLTLQLAIYSPQPQP